MLGTLSYLLGVFTTAVYMWALLRRHGPDMRPDVRTDFKYGAVLYSILWPLYWLTRWVQ